MLFMAPLVFSLLVKVNGLVSRQEYELLAGRHMKIGILPEPPYVKIERRGDKIVRVEGFVIEIVKWMAAKYHFSYEYIQPPVRAYGANVNGTWNGLVGMVIRREIDIAGTNLGITYARSLFVDFTYAFANDRMTLLVPYPRLASTITGVARPFHYLVWTGVTVSLIVVAIALWLINKVESYTVNFASKLVQISVSNQLWFLLRVFINAQDAFKITPSAQVLVACWCLAAFVLVQGYTSCLVSYLMAPKYIPFVNSIEELANNDEMTLVIWKYTTMEPVFMGATSGPLAKLGNKLRAHPENILNSYENIENIIYKERKAAAYLEFVSKITLSTDLEKTKECRLARANIFFYDARCGFALPKSSPLTSIFNKELVWLAETGLLGFWTNSYLPKPNRCSSQLSTSRQRATKTTLTLNFLSSAFILFSVGVGLSVLVFFTELLMNKCSRRVVTQ